MTERDFPAVWYKAQDHRLLGAGLFFYSKGRQTPKIYIVKEFSINRMEYNNFWHTRTVKQAFETLGSQPTGLSQTEAAARAAQYGPNEIQAAQRISAWDILIEQFKNVLILILLGATVISLFLGHGVESIVIAVIVLFAVLLGFIQEYRAERAIEALRQMAAPTATVLRNGREVEVAAKEVMPGVRCGVQMKCERDCGERP
jgi:Ca2+-transporting ATPase